MKKALLACGLLVAVMMSTSCEKEDVTQTENDFKNAIEKGTPIPKNGIENGTPPPKNG